MNRIRLKQIFRNLLLTVLVFTSVFWITNLIFDELSFWHTLFAALIASAILIPIRKYIDRK